MEVLPDGVKEQIGDEGMEILRQWVSETVVSKKTHVSDAMPESDLDTCNDP